MTPPKTITSVADSEQDLAGFKVGPFNDSPPKNLGEHDYGLENEVGESEKPSEATVSFELPSENLQYSFHPTLGELAPTVAMTNFYGILMFFYMNAFSLLSTDQPIGTPASRAFVIPALALSFGLARTYIRKHNRFTRTRQFPFIQRHSDTKLPPCLREEIENRLSYGLMTLAFTSLYSLSELGKVSFPAEGFLAGVWNYFLHLTLPAGAGFAAGEMIYAISQHDISELPSTSLVLMPALFLMFTFISFNNIPGAPDAYAPGTFDLIAPLLTVVTTYTAAHLIKLHNGVKIGDYDSLQPDVSKAFNEAKRYPLIGAFFALSAGQALSNQIGQGNLWQHGGYVLGTAAGAGLGLFARAIESRCEERCLSSRDEGEQRGSELLGYRRMDDSENKDPNAATTERSVYV